jgi:hypothetical protein
MGHEAALEPISVGRRGPKLRDTWKHRSLSQHGGEVQGHGTCGIAGAHLSTEMRSRLPVL